MDRLRQFRAGADAVLIGGSDAWRAGDGLLPGSFNPVHDGHRRLARAAEAMLGHSVAFELSVVNVDKPELTIDEVTRRLRMLGEDARIWLTRAPRFLDKTALFPGAVFVIGVDTAERLVAPRYYGNDEPGMRDALELIASRGCRFLVAGRVGADGRFITLNDIALPRQFHHLFADIPEDAFRLDISSTALRNQEAGERQETARRQDSAPSC